MASICRHAVFPIAVLTIGAFVFFPLYLHLPKRRRQLVLRINALPAQRQSARGSQSDARIVQHRRLYRQRRRYIRKRRSQHLELPKLQPVEHARNLHSARNDSSKHEPTRDRIGPDCSSFGTLIMQNPISR